MADRLQELLEAQVLLKSLYFYGVFFLCPMRGYRPSGRMYNLLFFHGSASVAHVGARSARSSQNKSEGT